MRISRRTSGRRDSDDIKLKGRGEYEISEPSPDGYTTRDIVDRKIFLQIGNDLVIDTGSSLKHKNGKWRIRLTDGAEMHPHLQVAAVLLMPHPIREDRPLGRGQPVMRSDQYAIEHIEITRVDISHAHVVTLRIGELTLRNASYDGFQLDSTDRLAQVSTMWDKVADLPSPLPDYVTQHRDVVTAGGPIPKATGHLVAELQRILTESAADYGISYRAAGEDPLPDLLELLQEIPEPPLSIEQVEPEEIQIRKRTVKEWRRWANSRGAASARFRLAIRQAYNSTCVVCGRHFPSTPFNSVAGVDAAHILPWAGYELDYVSNGLCLCRQHHWAFDEGLIQIRHDGGRYYVEIPDDIRDGLLFGHPAFSLQELMDHTGEIPEDRLPHDPHERPDPRFLEELLRQSDGG